MQETSQDLALFKEFIQFCDSKPKYWEIDHNNGWESCAVGRFFEWQGPRDVNFFELDQLLGEEGGTCESLQNRIGNQQCPSNYGDFTTFLKLELDKLELMVDNEGN